MLRLTTMKHSDVSDRLTAEDAVFLYLDTKDMPLHIATVMVFDGKIPLEDFTHLIESKLPQLPRYRQRVVMPPFNVGHPTWEDDAAFDIKDHIFEKHLKRGTDGELQKLTAHILSEAMDRDKPLWDFTIANGLGGGRCAIILRVHHCLADGIAYIGLLNVILDTSPLAAPPPPSEELFQAVPQPDDGAAFAYGLTSSYGEMLERMVSMGSYALNVADIVVAQGFSGLNQLIDQGPDLFGPFKMLPFNKPCLGPRRLVWTEVPMSDVTLIREACGAKLNDVVLTLVTSAIRRYVIKHRVRVKGRQLRMMVPVSIRSRGGIGDRPQGNRISMISVNVPLDISDPLKLLQVVRETTAALKTSGATDFAGIAGNAFGMLPAPLQALLGPYGSQIPFAPFNMVCTNVPGPQFPLYALGRKMLALYPYVPIGAQMGLNCAIQSYDGQLFFGFTGSDAAAPDVAVLPKLLDASFADLRKRAGVVTPKQSTPKRKAPRVRK